MRDSTPLQVADRWCEPDDGDAVRFCSTCAFARACTAQGMDKAGLRALHVLVEHVGPLAAGTHVFRAGDRFDAIAAVRAGIVKTCRVDLDGREQVLGFHYPGEVIGLNAIDGERYPCDAVALETVELCRFAFPQISELAARLPALQKELFRMLSRDIGHAERLGEGQPAEDRVEAFLADVGRRLARPGRAESRFDLPMSRSDIANYLRLTPETVSRVLRRLQDRGHIEVDGRQVIIKPGR